MRTRVLLAAAALLAAGCSAGSSPEGGGRPASTPSGASPKPGVSVEAASYSGSAPCGWRTSTTYRHVIWIWMENRTYQSVLGNSSEAPNLSSYAAKCGLATNYQAITHPSLPNYLAATSGSTGGVTSDCGPRECPQHRDSVFGQGDRRPPHAPTAPGPVIRTGRPRRPPMAHVRRGDADPVQHDRAGQVRHQA